MSGMSENSDLKNVGIVAVIIGGTVLVLGLIGVALTLTCPPISYPGQPRDSHLGREPPGMGVRGLTDAALNARAPRLALDKSRLANFC